jgi:hypothetical protein
MDAGMTAAAELDALWTQNMAASLALGFLLARIRARASK